METILSLAEAFEPYTYKEELVQGQIRLLKLMSITNGLPHFTFTITSVPDPAISYLALSYVWGPEADRLPIIVNDARLMVTQNCWAALSYLTPQISGPECLHVWVDAVCINQGNDPKDEYRIDGVREKAQQIAQMGDIYSCATKVVAFLGIPSPGSDTAMRDMNRLGQEALDGDITGVNSDHFLPNNGGPASRAISRLDIIIDRNIGGLFRGPKMATEAIMELLGRPWFSRAWVIQELALPKPGKVTFACGVEQCSFERAFAAIYLLQWAITRRYEAMLRTSNRLKGWNLAISVLFLRFRRQFGVEPGWTRLRASSTLQLRQTFWQRRLLNTDEHGGGFVDFLDRSMVTLLPLLYVGEQEELLRCRDPEDKIRALHGLVSLQERAWLTPLLVCQPALTWVELYTSVAGRLIVDGHVDLLSLCRRSEESKQETGGSLPSWVPDWRHRIRIPWSGIEERHRASDEKRRLFNVSQGTTCRARLTDDTAPTLIISGHYIDKISEVRSEWAAELNQDFDFMAAAVRLGEIQGLLGRWTGHVYGEEEREEAKWRIPTGDKQLNAAMQAVRAGEQSHAAYLAMMRLFETGTRLRSSSAGAAGYGSMMMTMHGSRTFISDKGYVGLCPLEAEAGATIFAPLGAHVPYVIRRAAGAPLSEGDEWELVGEAYVHGIMDSELNLSAMDDQIQEFRLV